MGLHDVVKMREDLPNNFRWDWINPKYRLNAKMAEEYKNSVIGVTNGQLRSSEERFCKNASIFDVTGTKIAWGDVAPLDVKLMKGVYYILSEHRSFWHPSENRVKGWSFRKRDPNSRSPFQHLLSDFEAVVFDPSYVRRNAIARIVDGEIQTSRELIYRNHPSP